MQMQTNTKLNTTTKQPNKQKTQNIIIQHKLKTHRTKQKQQHTKTHT